MAASFSSEPPLPPASARRARSPRRVPTILCADSPSDTCKLQKGKHVCLILCIHPHPGHSKSNEWMGHKGTRSRSCSPHSFFQTAAGGPPLKVTPTYSLLCHLSPFSAPSPGSLRLYLENSMQSPLPPGNLPWKFLQLSAGLPSVTGRPTDSPGIRSSLPPRPWPL